MKPADRLQRLFQYDDWASGKVLAVLEANSQFETRNKAVTLFAHLLNAQRIWHRRIKGEGFDDLDLWPEYTLAQCTEIYRTMPSEWSEVLKTHSDNPDAIISYKNTKGEAHKSPLSDILHHLIIHGQHHRAQMAALFREAGITPPATDFIYFTRLNN